MATKNFTEETQESLDRPAFEEFSWTDTQDLDARFAGRVQDIALGIRTVLQMIEHDELQRNCTNMQKIMDISAKSSLQRFAISAADMLGEAAASQIDRINARARKH